MGLIDIIKRPFMREAGPTHSGKSATAAANYTENVVAVNTPYSALKVSAVHRAVDLISNGLGILPLQYKRLNRAKGYYMLNTAGSGAKLNYLLSVKPNSRLNSFTFYKNIATMLLLHGNAFVYPVRDFGVITELILCAPNSVYYDIDSNRYYIYDAINGINKVVEASEILHFKHLCSDGGYWGSSTISYAAQTLGIAATGDRETLKRFATGGRFKAILQGNNTLKGFGNHDSKEMYKQSDDLMEALHRGDDILVLRGDNKVDPISMNSADMQFLESRKFTIREIARFFNVPPSKLMDDSNANYKSAELSNVAFYAEALQPIVTEIEREFAAKLLTESTYLDYKFCFDLSKIYALDLEAQGRWNKDRLESGQATVNDIRREADKEPVEGGDDVYLSVNLAALGSAKLGNEANKEG